MTKLPSIFDSHAHYESHQFDKDRDFLLSEYLPENGVCGVMNMGSDLDACRATIKLCEKYSYFYGAAGIHPECARELPNDWLGILEGMLSHEKILALGEIGLDYHWLEDCPKDRQQEVFAAQLELAGRLELPAVIHDREAHGDTMQFLRKYRPRGVVHCFSGSVELSREIVDLGMYIGLGGAVTFKNARHAVVVAADIPLDRLLLETDAPYMAPVPFRGKRNDSTLIKYIAQRIAEIRKTTPEAVLEASAVNACALFSALPTMADLN